MKKIMLSLTLSALLTLSACGGGQSASPAPEDDTLHILATTYPVYLFTTAVTEGVEGVEVSRLIQQEISCLHDYTLTVNDMKAVEAADVVVLNGVGLEDFLSDARAASDAPVIDCSEGVELLPALGHEGHDHDTEYDPHIWMEPARAAQMVENIRAGLTQADPDRAERYAGNASDAAARLANAGTTLREITASGQPGLPLPQRELITFHDGFQYFAEAFGLDLLKAIEEEEGSEASAAEIKEIVGLVRDFDIPAIFTEKNGSDATAQAISRETGCQVCQLDLIMSGDGQGLDPYLTALEGNVETIANALGEGQVQMNGGSAHSHERTQARRPARRGRLFQGLLPAGGGPGGHRWGPGHRPRCGLRPPLRGDHRPHWPQRGGEVHPVQDCPGPDSPHRDHRLPAGGGRAHPAPHRLCAPVPQL